MLYNLAGGIILSTKNSWYQVSFGALYIDVFYFYLLLLTLRWARLRKPATFGESSPIALIGYRLTITSLPTLLLIQWVFYAKIQTGSYFTYVTNGMMALHAAIAIMLMLVYTVLDLGYELMDSWRKSEAEKEKFIRLHTQAQYENLKAQINPHFLFNSLNTLSSLIAEDGDRARIFVRQLSTVYRHILDSRDAEVVSLDKERFIFDAFIFLCETRFEDNFRVVCTWPERLEDWKIPPMTLQILAENAIKHNVISREKPLQLSVSFQNGYLWISNPNQPKRRTEEGTGFGLQNIRERIQQFTQKPVEVIDSPDTFTVKIPLIQ